MQRIHLKITGAKLGNPMLDQFQYQGHIQPFMERCVTAEVDLGELEQRRRGPKTRALRRVLLQMHKGSCKLDQTLEERVVRPAPFRQPKFLKNIMSFVEQPAIETLEVTQVMRIQFASPATLDERRNFCAFLAQAAAA